MDYAKHYRALIGRARKRRLVRCSIERHHILPRCMGGGHEDENIARLTPEEHYIAHLLLARMYPDNRKLAYACVRMKARAGCGYGGSHNKRYAKGMERRQGEWMRDWRFKYQHRPRKKKRYGKAHLEHMARILAPKHISS